MKEFSEVKEGVVSVYERELRQETSRLAAMANKRLARLEARELTDSNAYRNATDNGRVRFGVRGKTFNEVQKEFADLNRFINNQTSTIRGIHKTLRDIADVTNIEYSNMKDLEKKASTFFHLASQVEQYLRTVDDMASAIGYQKIWEVINTYVKDSSINLGEAKGDIDSIASAVTDLIRKIDKSGDRDKKPDIVLGSGKKVYGLI